ncbi:ATP-binding protein [Streptomyces sp. NBC_00696]|uniref:ATP-binding protein n=2 Tax=Streptomyces sp. NBC_00696 TaxID=2903672 RepID=UPI002E317B02|nr:ATP-binding protein [Streptomyces sp. NBC_00696]
MRLVSGPAKIRASRTARPPLGTARPRGRGQRVGQAGPYAPLLHDEMEQVTSMPPIAAGRVAREATGPKFGATAVPIHETGGDADTAQVANTVAAGAEAFRLRGCPELDESFERHRGSTAGSIAEADLAVPRRARVIVRARLRHLDWPGLVEPAELLVTELVTNAFKHGLGDVGLRMYLTDTHLLIEVRDGSHQLPVLGDGALDDEDGRGLFLVAAIADDWGVSSDGTTTWCSLPL